MNRLKLLKRRVYECASFDLSKAQVLHAFSHVCVSLRVGLTQRPRLG
jgi:hypothetical protein